MTVFARRWIVVAYLPGQGPATTLFDVTPDRTALVIHPAAISTFSLRFAPSAIPALRDSLDGCGQIPGWHAQHGEHKLDVQPYPGPQRWPWCVGSPAVQFTVKLTADHSMTIVFAGARHTELLTTLDEIARYCTGPVR